MLGVPLFSQAPMCSFATTLELGIKMQSHASKGTTCRQRRVLAGKVQHLTQLGHRACATMIPVWKELLSMGVGLYVKQGLSVCKVPF